jgi:hypothetical protein
MRLRVVAIKPTRVAAGGRCTPALRSISSHLMAKKGQRTGGCADWGSPIAGQMTLFPEQTEGNGNRLGPKAIAVIVDQVKDENNGGAADIEDVKLFVKRNKAATVVRRAGLRHPPDSCRQAPSE